MNLSIKIKIYQKNPLKRKTRDDKEDNANPGYDTQQITKNKRTWKSHYINESVWAEVKQEESVPSY